MSKDYIFYANYVNFFKKIQIYKILDIKLINKLTFNN